MVNFFARITDMKVFETFDSAPVRKNPEKEKTPASIPADEGKKVKGKKSKAVIKKNEKPNLSAEQIRTKVANKDVETDTDKVEISSKAVSKKLFEFEDSNTKPSVAATDEVKEKTHVLKPDVGLNDPSDPATVGKLKKLINTGAVQFNPKERETLSKIIEQ
jgi:hypothetical protein